MGSLIASQKHKFKAAREHDYVFDNLFLVSGEKDYNKAAMKAAISTAQPVIFPVYDSMFSELQHYSSCEISWHTNPRLPNHVDRSYDERRYQVNDQTPVNVGGRDRFRYFATPKIAAQVATSTTNVIIPEEEIDVEQKIIKKCFISKQANKSVQTIYRESSAQTVPYEPDYTISEECRQTPEVLKLDDIKIDPEHGVRFEMIEKLKRLRIKRAWMANGASLKILKMIEETEQKYRELEIEKEIMEKANTKLCTNVNTQRPKTIWTAAKNRLQRSAIAIEHKREREIRKINAKHDEYNREIEQFIGKRNAPRLPSSTAPKTYNMTLNNNFTPKLEDIKRHTIDLGQKMKAKINGCTRKHRMHHKRVLEFDEQLQKTKDKSMIQNENENKTSEKIEKDNNEIRYSPFSEENLDNIVTNLIDNVIQSISENENSQENDNSL